jgi:DNA-binding transcriptional LysR family regulator
LRRTENLMQLQNDATNIPTDIIRTLVTIADTGSFTKAAARLNLSQPAVSSQIKKLQRLIGGPLFEASPSGVAFTSLGKVVLGHGRKILNLNDQMLSLVGARLAKKTVRLGVSYLYAENYLAASATRGALKGVAVQAGHSDDIRRLLLEGYLDVACVVAPEENSNLTIIDEWQEQLVWVRSKDFVLSPGQPVPLVAMAGSVSEATVIKALERASLAYEIVFVCSELQTRLAAVAQGIGLMAIPARLIKEPLIEAKEYYLPKIDPVRAAVCVRNDLDGEWLDEILLRLRPQERERMRA